VHVNSNAPVQFHAKIIGNHRSLPDSRTKAVA